MFEQAFKNIDDVLWKEAGCTTELDYTEQTSWLLFLKYLDDFEQDKAVEAQIDGKGYTFIIDKPYRWGSWAAPKGKDGKLDHNAAMVGDDLRDFVNLKLFPYLSSFKQKAGGANSVEYKIGEIFGEIKNKIQSGYNLREIIDHIDEMRFRSQAEKYELSQLYEEKIKRMGNAGRNGGEYYTPRPLIRTIVHVVKPQLGERIYDGACGSAGFLCESLDYLKAKGGLTTKDAKILQERTFYGKEKKSLAYVIAIMNMILHGIEAPNILHTNTLTENLADVQDKDRFDVVMANPPFGGKERKEVQQNFPIRTGETAFLFLQHFIKMLKAGGRGGVVIKNTFLSNTDNAAVSLRKLLLESCNLHTVLDCPSGTFQGAAQKTVVLFFEKGAPTRKIWYYQLDPRRNLGKTNPLNDDDLTEFVTLQKTYADSPRSWSISIASVDKGTSDLAVKNPSSGGEVKHRSPQDIINEIAALDAERDEMLQSNPDLFVQSSWNKMPFEDCIEKVIYTRKIQRKDFLSEGKFPIISQEDAFINGYWDNEADLFRITTPVIIFGDHTKVLKYVDFDFVLGADGVKILQPRDFLVPKFFYYQLRSIALESLGYARHYKLLREVEISFPARPEQERIVYKLEEAFNRIAAAKANAEKKLDALESLKKSLLHQAFINEL